MEKTNGFTVCARLTSLVIGQVSHQPAFPKKESLTIAKSRAAAKAFMR